MANQPIRLQLTPKQETIPTSSAAALTGALTPGAAAGTAPPPAVNPDPKAAAKAAAAAKRKAAKEARENGEAPARPKKMLSLAMTTVIFWGCVTYQSMFSFFLHRGSTILIPTILL